MTCFNLDEYVGLPVGHEQSYRATIARELTDGLRAGADIAPTRGAPRLVTWREAAMILAGYPDDRLSRRPLRAVADRFIAASTGRGPSRRW